MGESTKQYYCKRCKNSYPSLIDEKNQEKIVTFFWCNTCEQYCASRICSRCIAKVSENDKDIKSNTEERTRRFLACKHSVDINNLPTSYGDSSRIVDCAPNPETLRELNVKVTLEYLRMTEDQRVNFIAFHRAQYEMHLMAAKEAKYVLQVLEEETDKYIAQMGIEKGEDEKKRIQQRFDYLVWKKPSKTLEVAAKEKAREDNKVEKTKASIDSQMEKLREMMRKGLGGK